MKFFTDKNHTDQSFEVGDWVFLQLRPYRQMSIALRQNLKLEPRYYRPFQVIKRVGQVAYTLELPPGSQIFPTFHVSNLKKKLGHHTEAITQLLYISPEGTLSPVPEKLLECQLKKKGQRATTEVLTQWAGTEAEEATWEDLHELKNKFPDLVDKVF
jgi:hypothetical protein